METAQETCEEDVGKKSHKKSRFRLSLSPPPLNQNVETSSPCDCARSTVVFVFVRRVCVSRREEILVHVFVFLLPFFFCSLFLLWEPVKCAMYKRIQIKTEMITVFRVFSLS